MCQGILLPTQRPVCTACFVMQTWPQESKVWAHFRGLRVLRWVHISHGEYRGMVFGFLHFTYHIIVMGEIARDIKYEPLSSMNLQCTEKAGRRQGVPGKIPKPLLTCIWKLFEAREQHLCDYMAATHSRWIPDLHRGQTVGFPTKWHLLKSNKLQNKK